MYNLCSCAVLNSTNSLAKSLREGERETNLDEIKQLFGGLHTVVGRWPPEKIPYHHALLGDASVVEHIHEEVVEIAVDNSRAGDVLRRRFVSAAIMNVELLNFESVLWRE